jgi:diguanylate cyclase (GGDEF)-like protein/PAS domain S-box-containing protein
LYPDDADRVLAEWARAAAGGRDSVVEYRFRRPDGRVSWIQGFATAVRDGDGAIVGWVGTCLDLTDRKRAEEALLIERDRFRVAFDDAPIGMALVAPNGMFLRVNRTLCEILGYAEPALLQSSFQELTHPDDLDADLEQVRRVLAGESRTYQMEKRYMRRDGQVIWAMLSVSLVRDQGGQPLYFVSQIEDITVRKQAEQSLQRLADHDPLTGLLNRRRFNEELERELARTRRHGGQSAVLMIDLDRFKTINDTFGHRAGDDVLCAVARALEDRLRSSDVIARVGGDEFAVIAIGTGPDPHGQVLAHDLAEAVRSRPIVTGDVSVAVTASIGVSVFDAGTPGSADDVFVAADDAMYEAKRRGRDRVADAAA